MKAATHVTAVAQASKSFKNDELKNENFVKSRLYAVGCLS